MDKAVATGIFRWLSQEDYAAKHDRVKSKRFPGTLQWFVNSSQFRRWLDDDQQVLLCLGRPGSGKTVVSSMVVDTLFERHGNDLNIGIAFIYPVFDQENQYPEQLLRSMLLQLGQRSPSVPSALVDLYHRAEDDASPPSIQDLLGVMSDVISNLSKVYLVIDALDELSTSHRRKLLPGLLKLRESLQVSLFVTSRSHPDVIQRFSSFPTIEMDVTDAELDLHAYISQRIGTLPEFVLKDFTLRTQIHKAVREASEGLFLVAAMLMDRLSTARNTFSLRKMLPRTSVSLHELYAEKMDSIARKPKEEESLAKSVLSWLLLAQRPLKKAELQNALRMEVRSSRLDKDNVPDVTEIVALCEGLVVVGKAPVNILSLVHTSAADYLRSTLDHWCPDANAVVATGCLTYLAFDTFGSGHCKTDQELESRLWNNPLYEYAAQNWPNHLCNIQNLPERAVTSFLLNQKKVASACQAMNLSEIESRQPGYSQNFDDQQTGLHLAAQLGLEHIVELLLIERQDRAAKDSLGRTPLWRATEGCHEGVMRILSRVDRTSFTLMLNKKQETLAYSLLQVAGQTVKDSQLRTALHIGVIREDLDLIRHALECGVDINVKDVNGHSAIQLAIQNHMQTAVNMLLERSASIEGITASRWLEAYGKPSFNIVELLEDTLGHKQVVFLTSREFIRDDMPASHNKKRLRVLPDIAAWPVDNSVDPPSNQGGDFLFSKSSSMNMAATDEYIVRYSVVAPIPVRSKPSESETFSYQFDEIRVAWTLTPFPNSSGKDQWTAVDHLSTLQIGSIPDSGAAFCNILVNTIMIAWLELCSCIDSHLIMCRPDVLAANGEKPQLIRRLLEDANTWSALRRLLHKQITAIGEFRDEYVKMVDGDEAVDILARTTENFAHVIGLRIDKFDAVSAALIQLEFNLTSIREAQKSTSLNRSIKRLTWITFIFLPLVFVSGIFGMNVDALETNPPWWWYIIFMAGTLGLTMTVWIVFKRFPDLEDSLEHKLGWLVGPPKPKRNLGDSERGFISAGKKKHV